MSESRLNHVLMGTAVLILSQTSNMDVARDPKTRAIPNQLSDQQLWSRIAVDLSKEKGWRTHKEPTPNIRMELSWVRLQNTETVGALVRVINEGAGPGLVFPVGLRAYGLEIMNSSGRAVEALKLPPIDFPQFEKGELVLLYPGNVLTGVFQVRTKNLKRGSRYRVAVGQFYRVEMAGGHKDVEIEMASPWVPFNGLSK